MLFLWHGLGVSHKKEWDTFSRMLQDRKKFPIALSSYVQKSKLDMFNLWLEHGQSMEEHLELNKLSSLYVMVPPLGLHSWWSAVSNPRNGRRVDGVE